MPTHHRPEQVTNTLDLILTNKEGMVEGLQHSAPLGKSDHNILTINGKCYVKQSQRQEGLNMTRPPTCMRKCEVRSPVMSGTEDTRTCEGSWGGFSTRLKTEINALIPKTGTNVSKVGRPFVDE